MAEICKLNCSPASNVDGFSQGRGGLSWSWRWPHESGTSLTAWHTASWPCWLSALGKCRSEAHEMLPCCLSIPAGSSN